MPPQISPAVGTSPLDAPPPSPTPMGGQPEGGPFSARGLVPQVDSTSMPPEILTGLMQAAQTVSATLDSFAQVTPDKGAQLALIKELLQRYLAEVMEAGAGPVSPTSAGPAAPMGGIDRGISGPGSI